MKLRQGWLVVLFVAATVIVYYLLGYLDSSGSALYKVLVATIVGVGLLGGANVIIRRNRR